MVTKSGSNRYSGSGSYFLRDDSLQANTWTRNKSTELIREQRRGAVQLQAVRLLGGRSGAGRARVKNKLFFFAAQEWVNYFAVQTNTATVPTAKMRSRRLQRAARPRTIGSFSGARTIINPATGVAFPGNIIPAGRLSPTGLALLNAYPLPTRVSGRGANNAIISSENPQDQRKDNIRLDYRLNDKNQFTYRYGKYNWTAVDAFRGTFAVARTDWDRPNTTQTASWTSTLSSKLINEFSFTNSLDEVFINVFRGTDAFSGASTASTIRTSSRRTRKSRTRSRRSPWTTSPRSTAARIRRRRAARSTPSTTRRPT